MSEVKTSNVLKSIGLIFGGVALFAAVFTYGFSNIPTVAWIVFVLALVFAICYYNGVFGTLFGKKVEATPLETESTSVDNSSNGVKESQLFTQTEDECKQDKEGRMPIYVNGVYSGCGKLSNTQAYFAGIDPYKSENGHEI